MRPRLILNVPQPVVVLPNGDETRGLVIPVNAGDAALALARVRRIVI